MVGLALGGVLSNYLEGGKRWYRLLAPSAAGFGLLMIGMGFLHLLPDLQVPLPFVIKGASSVPLAMAVAFGMLGLAGILGGLFMIPTAAFIQVRAPAKTRGTVIAAVAFATFAGIMLAAALEVGLIALFTLAGPAFIVLGGLCIAMAVYLQLTLPKAAAREESE